MERMSMFILIVSCSYLGLFSVKGQHQEKQLLLHQKESQPQQKSDKPTVSLAPVDVSGAWNPGRVLYKGWPAPSETTIKPEDDHILLAVEVALKKGEKVISERIEFKTLPDGSWSPAGVAYSGDKGGSIRSTEALIIDSSGNRYSPLGTVSVNMIFLSQPRGDIKAGGFPVTMVDMEAPDAVSVPAKGNIVLLYEIPAGRSGFRLKVAESEPIAVEVKTKH